MPSTIKPIEAFDFCKRFIKNMNLDTVQARILDDVNKIMWMAAPWRWTIGALPNITLAANTQDYTIALPNDFLYALESYVTDQAGGTPRDLRIEPFIATSGIPGQPSRVAFTGTPGTNGTARIFPKFQTLPTPTPVIISTYKKQAPSIKTVDDINNSGILVFDDEWFYVYESGVLWLAYMYADVQCAGSATFDSGKGSYVLTGQRGVFESNIQMMRDREKILGIDSRVAPDARMDK